MGDGYLIGAIAVAALATYATRILPFLLFSTKEPGPLVRHIERHMPMMIMVILVFYAIKDVPFGEAPYGIAELLGIGVAAVMHKLFGNALLSIVAATLFYMVMVQGVL